MGAAMPGAAGLDSLIAETRAEVTAGLAQAGWAEDEIAGAIARRPDAENDLFHAFPLLAPAFSSTGWDTEFVFRGHCRELLERVAAGGDTRPGTAAECCLAMAAVSMAIPLHGTAAGFYHRMWDRAFPANPVWQNAGVHYEALHGQAIDDIEHHTRRKLAVPSRRLDPARTTCGGRHWGAPVTCKYTPDSTERRQS